MSARLIHRSAVPAVLLTLAGAGLAGPAVSRAAQCGPGTVYDAPTDTCVVAPQPAQWNAPPPAPPPPPLPPISICPPIPFVAVCFPVN